MLYILYFIFIITITKGLPVPPYVGYPLDPPLRSRFQSRDIRAPSFQSQVDHIMSLIKNKSVKPLVEKLVSISLVLGVQNDKSASVEIEVPEFPISLASLSSLISFFPKVHPRFLVDLLYPYPLLPTCDLEQLGVIEGAYRRFGVKSAIVEAHEEARQTSSGYNLANLEKFGRPTVSIDALHYINKAIATFSHDSDSPLGLPIYCGPQEFSPAEFFVETPYHRDIISAMVVVHAGGKDICLIGTQKGVGKSALVRQCKYNSLVHI